MDHAQLINRVTLELPALLVEHLLRPAGIMAAVDTGQNLRAQQLAAYRKDINQDLLAHLLTNPALADIAQDLLEDQADPAGLLADIDLTRQEDLLDLEGLAVLDRDVLRCQWTLAQVQNLQAANTLLQKHEKKKQRENSKTSKISKLIKSLKSTAHLIRAINKASVMKTMKAGAHAKAAATNGCQTWAKSSLSVLKL
jgi:hypothetical protein